MTFAQENVFERALSVLTEPDPLKKTHLSQTFNLTAHSLSGQTTPDRIPSRPSRPGRPELLPPKDMPKRSTGQKGRIALLHALAHIELNAIDLAWDIILRFGASIDDSAFLTDWIQVARDEARHFELLSNRLEELGHSYGDLSAHDGLWEAAEKTSDRLLDRLAVIPMFLEARGVDTAPKTTERFKKAGDMASAAILDQIFMDEITHLKIGVYWFEELCRRDHLDPYVSWKSLITKHLHTRPKMPVNEEARREAGMSPQYWENWPV